MIEWRRGKVCRVKGCFFVEKLKRYVQSVGARRILFSFVGNFFIAVGVSIFKYTLLGNDPSSAMAMAVAARLNVSFTLSLFCFNAVWFLAEVILNRSYIGIGTFVNWLLIGPVVDLFTTLYAMLLPTPSMMVLRILIMLVGVAIVCFGVSVYQTSNSGVSPYDSLSLILCERSHIPYFWCRILFDAISAMIAWLLGGIVGLGTLTCALGLGPIISFFDRTVSWRILRQSPAAEPTQAP